MDLFSLSTHALSTGGNIDYSLVGRQSQTHPAAVQAAARLQSSVDCLNTSLDV